ncbi:hypothetical protein HJC22_42440 [Corallococcus exiguus]|nr:hypothetical protein [Corallococcus exiguus]
MVAILEADAALPQAKRKWLKDFDQPRIETHVGVAKADLRFADVLVIEESPSAGLQSRVETFSFKSRDLSLLKEDALVAQMVEDAGNALRYYGGELKIVRKQIRQKTRVQRVRLIYEGGELKPANSKNLTNALREVRDEIAGVEVFVQ